MSASDAFGKQKRSLLRRLGLQPPPPGPDDEVVFRQRVEKETADRYVAILARARIGTQERVYVLPDRMAGTNSGPDADSRVRFALFIHRHDLDAANALFPPLPPLSDEELTRQSEEAYARMPHHGGESG